MKIMKLLASCAMVGALTAVCASGAFAEVTGTITDIRYTAEDATAGTSATVTFNIDNYNVAGGDYTVLVLNKNVDGSVISDDIVQIDQLTNTTTATNKTMSVSLVLPDDINNSEKKSADGTYYVRVGGAAVSTANPKGYISTQFEVAAPGAGNDVEVTVDNTTADAFGTTGSSAVIVTATSEIPTGKAVAYDGTPMYYTEYTVNGKTVVKYVALCANFDAEKIALVDGANTKIVYGNLVNRSESTIDIEDINQMINIILDSSKADTVETKLIADVTADGLMDIDDINQIINLVLNANYIPVAAQK